MGNINADTQLGAPTGQFLFQLASLLFQACALPKALLQLLLSFLQDSSGLVRVPFTPELSVQMVYVAVVRQLDNMGYLDTYRGEGSTVYHAKGSKSFPLMFQPLR